MTNTSVEYLGLELENPIIAASSDLTYSLENIKKIAENEAGAIVLKSLFEEQIRNEIDSMNISISEGYYNEGLDYLNYYTKKNNLDHYLNLINEAKNKVKIPIIASINCISDKEWIDFAEKIESAGADALELNMFILPNDLNKPGNFYEELYFNILDKLKEKIKIPVALKIGSYFSNPLNMINKLAQRNADGIVLFNRFFRPDIDIDNLKLKSSPILSNCDDILIPLRWIGMLSGKIKANICASTGVYDYEGLVKYILAGADTVQLASVLYARGFKEIKKIKYNFIDWMKQHNFNSIDDFKGLMSQEKLKNPQMYERFQFMKNYADRN